MTNFGWCFVVVVVLSFLCVFFIENNQSLDHVSL